MLTDYLKFFFNVGDYHKINQGRELLDLFLDDELGTNQQQITKKICLFLKHAPYEGKMCTLQFIKNLVEAGHLMVFF